MGHEKLLFSPLSYGVGVLPRVLLPQLTPLEAPWTGS